MSASRPSPNPSEKRKPYIPPTLTRLTPEAAKAALERLGKEQDDKLAEALRKLAGAACRRSEVTEPRGALSLVKE